MPDTILNITARDNATQTFKKVQESFKQMETMTAKFNRQGPFSQKDVVKSSSAIKSFHKEFENGLKVLKDYEKEFDLVEKRISQATKSQKKFTEGSFAWKEKEYDIRQLGKVQQGIETKRDRLLDALTRGPGEAGTLQRQAGMSEEGMAGFMGRFGKAIIGGIGLATSIGLTKKMYGIAMSTNENLMDTAANLGDTSDQIHDLVLGIQSGRGTLATQMGFSPQQVSGLTAQFARTGAFGGGGNYGENIDTVLNALSYQRRFGVSPSSFVNVMGAAATGGRAGGVFGPEQQGTIMAEAIGSGLKRGRFDEFVESVADLTKTMQQQGSVMTDPAQIGMLLAALGQSGSPILQGARGAAVISQLNSGLMNPGGGIAGRLAMLNVAGFGGNNDFWQSQVKLSQGFGGPGGKNLFRRLLGQAQSYGPEGSEEFMTYVMGLNPSQAHALMSDNVAGGLNKRLGRMSEGQWTQFAASKGLLSPAQNVDAVKDFMTSTGLAAPLQNMITSAVVSGSMEELGQTAVVLLADIAHDVDMLASFLGGNSHAFGTATTPAGAALALVTHHLMSAKK